MVELTSIDAFAGAGGLSVGLRRAGFKVVAAIEIDKNAISTYQTNHPAVHCINQDISKVSGTRILKEANCQKIDLLAGCPPCQGFTSLTAKYRHRVDPRNELVLEMARLAEEIRPRAIMMENVPGLALKGEFLYQELRERLTGIGYELSEGILQVADYGVPQLRRRLVLLGGLGFDIPLPDPTHSKISSEKHLRWRTVRDAIEGMSEPLTLNQAKKEGALERSDWHIVRNLSEQNKIRIRSVRAGETWNRIPEHLRPKCHRGGFKGFFNVYGRMHWDRPSPTITGGCTTFSKGRFGHPDMDRTISVREAAMLQTFPRDYKLDTPYMEHACNMVGNALPCNFAEAISRECVRSLKRQ